MIPYDFIYCCPDTLQEAYDAFIQLQTEGKQPMYYSGGSEIITMARAGTIQPGAVIDIKKIPDCTRQEVSQKTLHIGAACTLNQIKEVRKFPLMALTCGRIADHTNQCRITLGGNLCGTIIYREVSLPLLLSDASISIYGPQGLRTTAFADVFHGRMQLMPGELIVQVHIPMEVCKAKYFHVKRTANDKIDYPLVTMSAIYIEDTLRVAFSGVCAYPFRSREMEQLLNDTSLSCAQRALQALDTLPAPVHNAVGGTSAYRSFVFQNMVQTMLEEISHGKI